MFPAHTDGTQIELVHLAFAVGSTSATAFQLAQADSFEQVQRYRDKAIDSCALRSTLVECLLLHREEGAVVVHGQTDRLCGLCMRCKQRLLHESRGCWVLLKLSHHIASHAGNAGVELLRSTTRPKGERQRKRCMYLHGPQHTPAHLCRSSQGHTCKPNPSCKNAARTSFEPCQACIGSCLHAD